MPPFKIQIKLGANEFSAEGDEASVKEQLAAFMAAINKTPAATPPARTPHNQNPAADAAEETETPPASDVPEDVKQLFVIDGDEVTLRVHPAEKNGDKVEQIRESFLSLMYGIRKINRVEDVLALTAVSALRKSGIPVTRLTDAIEPFYTKGIITKAGVGRGVRYRLTNRGMTDAERVVGELKQRL